MSVAIGNFVYGLTAGQPLVILGGTGPTLIYEEIVYDWSTDNNIPYLEFRFWIGLWTCIMLILLVVFNASVIVRLFTRFTAEIFSTLISFIFIVEALEKLWDTHIDYPYHNYILYPFIRRPCDCYQFNTLTDLQQFRSSNLEHPVANVTNLGPVANNTLICNGSNDHQLKVGDFCTPYYHHNVLFYSIILFFGTFFVAYYLKKFKDTHFFRTAVSCSPHPAPALPPSLSLTVGASHHWRLRSHHICRVLGHHQLLLQR